MKSKKTAFTLIELLTVIAIIGILAAIIIPTVGAVKKSANKTRSKVQFNQWASAVELFKQEYGYYPAIGTSDKLNTTAFCAALTGKTYSGGTASDLLGNKRKLSFYSIADSDLLKDASGNVQNQLVDAFGNTDIAVFLDTDLDGFVSPTNMKLSVGNSIEGQTANNYTASVPSTTVRAGAVFYSAGYGGAVTDYVYSW